MKKHLLGISLEKDLDENEQSGLVEKIENQGLLTHEAEGSQQEEIAVDLGQQALLFLVYGLAQSSAQ